MTKQYSFWESYQELRKEFDFADLGIDPDEIFGDVRDPSPGRDFQPFEGLLIEDWRE